MSGCGGCQGLGSHQRHCPRHPQYTVYLPMADAAEDIGDRIGGNDPGLANHAYMLASRLQAKHRTVLEQKQARALSQPE